MPGSGPNAHKELSFIAPLPRTNLATVWMMPLWRMSLEIAAAAAAAADTDPDAAAK